MDNLLSPISIAFAVIIIGYYLGRIKIIGVSLDLAAVLIVAVAVGWILSVLDPINNALNSTDFHLNMKFFSSFGTALFVSTIGITTGYSVNVRQWKDMKAFLIGSLMAVSAFVTMKIIYLLDRNISFSKLLGSFCGALTTTPGLSAASELTNVVTQEVTLGYGCTYFFGVIATVLFVQIAIIKTNAIYDDKEQLKTSNESRGALSGLIQIGITIVIGRLIGIIEIFDFSLGNSVGMLCVGVVVGLIVKKYFPNNWISVKEFTPFRSIGLMLFFAGNGIPAGMQIYNGFDIKVILYGALMTIIPIAFGVILYKLFFKEGTSATVIAGGMTSTPAIGVLTGKHTNVCFSKYALAYFGALITIVILIRTNFTWL